MQELQASRRVTNGIPLGCPFFLPLHTVNCVQTLKASCLSAVDLGVSFGWYPGTTYAVWHGDGDKHCQLCSITGNASDWKYIEQKGAISYTKLVGQSDNTYRQMMKYDDNGDGMIDEQDLKASMGPNAEKKIDEKEKDEEKNEEGPPQGLDGGSSLVYVLKNDNYFSGMVRVFGGNLRSRMPLVPTPCSLEALACV
jgi:hypothetical protein